MGRFAKFCISMVPGPQNCACKKNVFYLYGPWPAKLRLQKKRIFAK